MIEKLDLYFWGLLIIAGLTMYYVYIVVNPTFEILENQEKQTTLAIKQNEQIINNTDRNAQYITAYINQSISNQDENLLYLATILNQSNTIGNQTADLILQSINKTTELNQRISIENSIQRAQIVQDITSALDHIDEQLDSLALQHSNLTTNQNVIQNQTGQISGFLGGPVITNETLEQVMNGIIAQAQNRSQ